MDATTAIIIVVLITTGVVGMFKGFDLRNCQLGFMSFACSQAGC